MTFELSTSEFQGPITALLSLIEKRKLPINDISLVKVTDEYLNFIHSLQGDDTVANKIHFIYVASTLALIKSKSLLPNLELTKDEEVDIEKLKERLMLYQRFQEIGIHLKQEMFSIPQFYQAKDRPKSISFQPHEGITLSALSESLRNVFVQIPEAPATKKEGYIRIAVHIEEVMDSLLERIKKSKHLDFTSFLSSNRGKYKHPKEQKVYAVVSFLALLEVIRNHGMDVQQEGLFKEITLTE